MITLRYSMLLVLLLGVSLSPKLRHNIEVVEARHTVTVDDLPLNNEEQQMNWIKLLNKITKLQKININTTITTTFEKNNRTCNNNHNHHYDNNDITSFKSHNAQIRTKKSIPPVSFFYMKKQ
ncbi:hypothetical protein AYR72_gp098 [Cnaphalocrocis medinalis granulovirus]|uniref:Uncharacterized protein n=1 Tax=Cnaphalocrocis medinalis granulovirus TaxID=1750712 RepID=A0A109WW96_9BBAC|nr:hypothetical protein AYR72_gp098 [Cnaphalocrocis medinalis granulovirus]AMF83849.1 hypothetical protein [Cnaphalocrocis medinalis granulovirus]